MSALDVLIGTMIELPRAALCADEIAAHADFFSFGTNDLTQTTLGLSRDDAEGKFLAAYVEDGVIPANPFQTLDIGGVGELVRMACERGPRGAAGPQDRHLRRARGRPGVGALLPPRRARLRVVLAVPRPDGPPLGGPGRAGGRTARSVGPPVAAPARGCEHGSVEKPSQAVELRRLADQHAALHRVAALVARSDVGADRIVAVATEEVGRLLGAEHARWSATATTARRRSSAGGAPTRRLRSRSGCLVQLDDGTALAQVWHTGQPARVDDYRPLRGPQVQYLRRTLGLRAAVAAPVVLRGRLWGAVSAATVRPEPFPPGTEQRLAAFAALLAQAVANSEAARELAASRQRLVEAGDAERRRIERNLHDGAQQRLVTLSLSLALLERQARMGTPPTAADLAGVRSELSGALEELRELARGIHPAVLADHGLRARPAGARPRARRCAWTW